MPRYPNTLVANLREHSVVPFIGAGFSIPSGLPSWSELLVQLLDEFEEDDQAMHIKEKFRSGELTALTIPELYNLLNAKKYPLLLFLKTRLGRNARPNAYHDLLCNLGCRTVVTTNFDNLIEDGFTSRGVQVEKIWKNEHLAFYDENRAVQVLKVHGSIDDIDTVVFSKSDYDAFKQERALVYHLLSTVFLTRTVLFLGTSLSDPHLIDMLEEIRSRIGPFMRTHYAVMYHPSRDTRETLQRYGIKIIDIEGSDPTNATVSWLQGLIEHLQTPVPVQGVADGSFDASGADTPPNIAVIVGDRRERPPETPGDFFAATASTRDLTWLCALRLPASTVVWNDKICLATQRDDDIPDIVKSRHLLIVGSPFCNLVARHVNPSAFFRFNIPQDDYDAVFQAEQRVRGKRRQEHDLITILASMQNYDELLSNVRGHGFTDPITENSHVGGFRDKDEDFATISLCAHPYSNHHVAILVAGIGLPGTMAALKALSAPGFFVGRPLGGLIRVVIPYGGWYERLTRSTPNWLTPAYSAQTVLEHVQPSARLIVQGIYSAGDAARYKELLAAQYRDVTIETVLKQWAK